MEKEFADIGFITFVLSGISYSALAVYLIISRQIHNENLWLTSAIIVSAVWSMATALSFMGIGGIIYFLTFLETLRAMTWIIFFSLLLARIWAVQGNQNIGKNLLLYLFFSLGITLTLSLLDIGFILGYLDFRLPGNYIIYSSLLLCVVIFLLVENLHRNSAPHGRRIMFPQLWLREENPQIKENHKYRVRPPQPTITGSPNVPRGQSFDGDFPRAEKSQHKAVGKNRLYNYREA